MDGLCFGGVSHASAGEAGVSMGRRWVRLDMQGDGVGGADGEFWGDGERGEGRVGERQGPVLDDGGEHEDAFHPGEALTDAVAGAAAEGEVSELGARGFGGLGKAAGIEAERVGPPAGVVVDDELGGDEVGAFGDALAGAHGVGLVGGAGDDPGGRVEAHGFGEDALYIGEAAEVGGFGRARVAVGVAADGEDFFAHAGLDVLMSGGEPEEEGEGVGGGFVPGEQDGEGFVAHLAVGHGAGFVFGFHQHAE